MCAFNQVYNLNLYKLHLHSLQLSSQTLIREQEKLFAQKVSTHETFLI